MTRPCWLPLLLCLGCDGGEDPAPTEVLEDLEVEPCNRIDDDKDGLIDEGNDIDGDGIPDCFDTEECDGLDNDGDGVVDEGFDTDGDGLGDCVDPEICNGDDDDGDGEIDEDFPLGCDPCNGIDDDEDGEIDEDAPDSDGDGIGDCLDVEECDGVDNDGDGEIDEDTDHDFDGLCDALDVEECDGWDNDGDGLRDEGFDEDGDSIPDCWIPEACDGVDNDGDGQIDEGAQDLDGDGLKDCTVLCGTPTSYTICEWDGLAQDFLCTYGQPVTVTSTLNGVVLDVDMAGWTTLLVTASVQAPTGIVLTVADSPTCNGYGGDAGTSAYDAEAQLDGSGTWHVYGTETDPGELVSVPYSFDPVADDVFVQVCDGYVGYRTRGGGVFSEISGLSLFQIDGNEPDFERPGGINDRVLHVGIGRTVFDALRNGTGIEDVVVVLGR